MSSSDETNVDGAERVPLVLSTESSTPAVGPEEALSVDDCSLFPSCVCQTARRRKIILLITGIGALVSTSMVFQAMSGFDTVLPMQQPVASHKPVSRTTRETVSRTTQETVVYKENNGIDDVSADATSKNLPFPVIDLTDEDDVPSGSSKAADALECRESVIAFVINATDAKDECDGLKKAFDKTCNTDSTQEIMEGTEKSGGGKAPGTTPESRRTRRKLFESLDDEQHQWKVLIYKTTQSLRSVVRYARYLWDGNDEFYAEDEVVGDAWEEARYQVAHDVDRILYRRLASKLKRRKESIEISAKDTDQVAEMKKEELEMKEANVTNSVVADEKTAAKPKQSLTLPTSKEHVSNKMLSETLLLGHEEKIQSAIDTAANFTNKTMTEAAVDAVVSAKAVQDTTAVVSAVLNDPTSVEARTCCASILNVFHENCDAPEEEMVSDKRLFLIVFVIAFCGMVKSLIRHFRIRWLPEAAGCILVGVLCGACMSLIPHWDISFDGDWFLRIMVPPIVFEAALSIDKRSFNRHVVPIMIYAVLGTLLSTVITAYIVHKGSIMLRGLCEFIPYNESLTFGALISSIDPIAVLSVLSNMGMTDTDTIYVLIFGESLLNDGVAIVLFQTLIHFLDDNLVIDTQAVITGAIHFFVVAFGSLVVGLGSGVVCTVYFWGMHGCQTPLVEVLMFFCWAFIPYYICDGVGWSGIVAVVATGFVMDLFVVGQHHHHQGIPAEEIPVIAPEQHPGDGSNKRGSRGGIFSKQGHLSSVAKTHVGFVTEILATMMETAIFAYLGVFLFSYRYHWNFWHTFLAIFACCASRAVMIPLLSLLANWITKMQQARQNCRNLRNPMGRPQQAPGASGVIVDKKKQLVLWFAGLRGAMSFALVENVPLYDTVTGEGSRMKAELKAMTSASIVFTVFCLGGCTYYMMEHLGIAPKQGGSPPSTEMTSLVKRGSSMNGVNGDDADDHVFTEDRGSKPSIMRQRPRMSNGSETS